MGDVRVCSEQWNGFQDIAYWLAVVVVISIEKSLLLSQVTLLRNFSAP